MHVKNLLPSVYSNRNVITEDASWNLPYKVDEPGRMVALLSDLIDNECAHAYTQSLASFRQQFNCVFTDLIAVRQDPSLVLPHDGLDLLLLDHGANISSELNHLGAFPELFDCFMQSLYGKKITSGELYTTQPERLERFLSAAYSQLFPAINIGAIATRWLSSLFYYSRCFGGLPELCGAFLATAAELMELTEVATPDGADLAVNVHVWVSQRGLPLADTLLQMIFIRYSQLDWSLHSQAKLLLGGHFVLEASSPALTTLRQTVYAQLQARPKLPKTLAMQLACQVPADINALKRSFPSLLAAVRAYSEELVTHGLEPVARAYADARLFKVLLKPLLILSRAGASTEITSLLTTYYHPALQWPALPQILFIIPNAPEGVVYCAHEQFLIHQQDTVTAEPPLVNIMNKALNQIHTLRGDTNQVLELPTRDLGMPMFELGAEFERTVSAYYRLDKLRAINLSAVIGLCTFGFQLLPIQALLLKELGSTLPYYVSLKPKQPYAAVRRVLLWQGNSMTTELEADALQWLFDNAGIELNILSENTATKADFLAAYQADDYDVIWVSSHGMQDSYRPDASLFHLSDNETVSITELAAHSVKRVNTRLLFLNVCEGGATTETGEFRNVGFGPLLSSTNQDVLSHLWMTDPWIALQFGVLFAVHLCGLQGSYFDAYVAAMRNLMIGRASTEQVLRQQVVGPFPTPLATLLERLERNLAPKHDSILRWGSPVYYI